MALRQHRRRRSSQHALHALSVFKVPGNQQPAGEIRLHFPARTCPGRAKLQVAANPLTPAGTPSTALQTRLFGSAALLIVLAAPRAPLTLCARYRLDASLITTLDGRIAQPGALFAIPSFCSPLPTIVYPATVSTTKHIRRSFTFSTLVSVFASSSLDSIACSPALVVSCFAQRSIGLSVLIPQRHFDTGRHSATYP